MNHSYAFGSVSMVYFSCLLIAVPVGLAPRPGAHLNREVKFSQDEPPSNEDCHRLLTEYMPDYILKTKITQRLFIKSA